MEWKVMTYNIQHGLDYLTGARIDLGQIADVIRAEAPDVVVLNEVRGDGEAADYTDQTGTLAKLLGWNAYFGKAFDVPHGGPYGNAILSPHPFTAYTLPVPPVEEEKRNRFYEPRCVIRAEFRTGDGVFAVFGSHFGLTLPEKENAVAAVCGMTDMEAGPFVFMGDLNMTPDDPILAPIFERLHDSAEAFECPKCSHPSDDPKIKIDYIFASDRVTVLAADIPAVTASDHRPHTARISF